MNGGSRLLAAPDVHLDLLTAQKTFIDMRQLYIHGVPETDGSRLQGSSEIISLSSDC